MFVEKCSLNILNQIANLWEGCPFATANVKIVNIYIELYI